ncbi:uncharacterized protein TM35_001781020 [Trypanosoma theileri]|uniref:Uncharacterized protein n=1 Tax=Trypanosoma theileri TaxID=67003 RepID=A0A1X0ND45_9TRYP|nr:uncharacterized protein TM35_001781020 [Trypanosoma theileri]ORC80165.1 hypothetical protein TM35_001781020 [Trypanosoma theileri]
MGVMQGAKRSSVTSTKSKTKNKQLRAKSKKCRLVFHNTTYFKEINQTIHSAYAYLYLSHTTRNSTVLPIRRQATHEHENIGTRVKEKTRRSPHEEQPKRTVCSTSRQIRMAPIDA